MDETPFYFYCIIYQPPNPILVVQAPAYQDLKVFRIYVGV